MTSKNQLDNLLVCDEWSNAVRWKSGERLQHLFEQRCDQFLKEGDAQHLAVDSAEGQWTYQQLDQRANQLARYLRLNGFNAGDVIGLLFDKSVKSYIAMLAVLKINAAYVPLDPGFPEDRIAYIAADAGLKTILTLSCYRDLTCETQLPVVCLDSVSADIDRQANIRLNQRTCQPVSELCYIIYTSGSTGRPKGVPIDQASICNFVRVAAEVYGYSSTDRVYQGLTIAFDFAVEEIWVPLIVGATLLPNQTGSSLLGCDLADFLVQNRITAMCCVPTLLATIDEELSDLRLLIVSGEACPQDLITRWYSDKCTILNAYGPTETTVTATLAFSKPNEVVTIGKPLPTYSVIILEPDTQKVLPFGEVGEIAVAGVGVARGYLNREEQTEKVFIEDFLNIPNNPSGLIYRTGDLGLINEQGNIEYQGRIDLQVKIRGYRIELTEIESVILQIPQIEQAVVDTFEPLPGVKELVAYYTLKENSKGFSQEKLLQTLREKLPSYMVPSYYEPLDVMPMMASDKADRNALPEPSSVRMSGANQDYIEPQTEMEKKLARILADLLKQDKVSIESHFFDDLGANSLLMAQYSAALRKVVSHSDISMRDIYAKPTVAQLAGHLDNKPDGVSTENKVKAKEEPFRIPSNLEYYSCGLLQLTSYFFFFFFAIWVFLNIVPWVLAAENYSQLYGRISGVFIVSFFSWTAFSIAVKWIFVGKWKAEKIPIWSLKYFRFWLIKLFIITSPMELFKGSPLYNVYLRLLGAKIGRNVVIQCRHSALCTDMLKIGDNTILRQDSTLISYKAKSNYIYTGSITLGKNVVVGEGSTIDINTVMEDNAQLAHASSLHENQVIPEGKHYHGTPAQETSTNFASPDEKYVSTFRKIIYSLSQLLFAFFGVVPLALCLLHYLVVSYALPRFEPLTLAWAVDIFAVALLAFIGFSFLGLLVVTLVPRFLNLFMKEDQVYVLYGFHYYIFKLIQSLSNSTVLNLMFGDSSYITHYLKWVGYKLSKVIQTGSNFGLEHKHDIPFLSFFGTGTMISDGLTMVNVYQSSTAFRLAKTIIGDDNYVGNNVYYPPGSMIGNNCLIATKALVPIDGKLRENVGLLGSPSFEIPRMVEDDKVSRSPAYEKKQQEGLRRKNRYNLGTIFEIMLLGFVYTYITLMLVYAAAQSYGNWGTTGWIIVANLFMFFSLAYFIALERGAIGFRRMKPIVRSIYHRDYWQVELLWKYSESFLRWIWLGTPFRSVINRALGIKQGKKVFDDGLYVSEKTLLEVGDYCNFNTDSVLQSHSLEQGIYKSGYIKVGNQCTIESNAFVHYSVTIGDNVVIGTDSFLMKGETVDSNTTWQGNPARAI